MTKLPKSNSVVNIIHKETLAQSGASVWNSVAKLREAQPEQTNTKLD